MVADASIRGLRSALSGKVLTPGDEGFEAARTVFNAAIDRRPSLTVRCATDDDVVRAIAFAREYDLLRLLVAHAGKVLTHNMILREVWGPNTDVQYLRIYIRALRQKIERDTEKPEYILTETGVGYRLRAPD